MKNILYKRENYLSKIRGFYDACDLIKVLTGIRRSGKSSIMKIIEVELLEKGINKENIIYINLDSKEYKNIKSDEQLEKTIDLLSVGNDIKYLFIDEIQNVEGFESIINAYRETGNYSIFITGSNSYLLSGELITKLTGRYIQFEIFPLSFYEYLDMKAFYNLPLNSNLLIELNNYATEGGFPRTLFIENIVDKRTYIEALVEEIFEKDIKRRIVVKKRESFNLVLNYLVNNFGQTTSLNSILKALNQNGNVISKATLLRYVEILNDAKILYECNRFDMKSKRALSGEKKYYLADLSLAFVSNPDSRINYGPVLENMFFVYAKSKGCSISVGRIGKLECDFIVKNKNLEYSYFQIAYTILANIEMENREYKPLELIPDNYPKYVLTTDYLFQKRNGIFHENIMEFMAKNKDF